MGESKVARGFSLFAKRNPVKVAGLVIGMRYGLGDLVIQMVSSSSSSSRLEFDPLRTLMFGAFGATYAMTLGYGVYNMLYPLAFRRVHPIITALFDCTIHSPFLYFPMFYMFNASYEAIKLQEKRHHTPKQIAQDGYQTWKSSFSRDFKACVAFWLPVNSINFSFVALHFRQPYMAVTGFAWAMILSAMQPKIRKDQHQHKRHTHTHE